MDTTILIALITALAAIFAPTITAQIQHKNTLRLKELDLFYKEKLRVYEDFATQYGHIYYNNDLNKYQAFLATAYETILLCDEDSREMIRSLIDNLTDPNSGTENGGVHQDHLNDVFNSCVTALQRDLQKSR